MQSRGTFTLYILRAAFAISVAALPGCLIDDPAPCTIQDSEYPDPECLAYQDPEAPFEFKLEYTTANGTRPDGRYGYSPPAGSSAIQAEFLCRHTLQFVFNSDQSYVDLELAEIAHYRGNICGPGYRIKNKIGEIRVKRTRQGTTPAQYDYDLELTCVEER